MDDDRRGAVIVIDGKTIGTAPLARDIPLDPNVTHHVKATLDTESAEEKLSIPAGQRRTAHLVLGPVHARQDLDPKAAPAPAPPSTKVTAPASTTAEPPTAPQSSGVTRMLRSPLFWTGGRCWGRRGWHRDRRRHRRAERKERYVAGTAADFCGYVRQTRNAVSRSVRDVPGCVPLGGQRPSRR